MKKLIIAAGVLLFSIGALYASEPGIKFETGSFSDIMAKAKSENRPVFVDIYTEWCGPCQRMNREVFTQRKVGEYFNAAFVNAKFDAEKGEGRRIAEYYQVTSYPTFLVLDAEGRLIGKMIGGSPANHFMQTIEKIRKKGEVKE